MCMSSVTKQMKTLNRKPIYGVKSVKAFGANEFGPLYVNQSDRWKKGIWYKPNYGQVTTWHSVKSGKPVARAGMYAVIIRALRAIGGSLTKVRPMLNSGNHGSAKYECGFHFFTNVEAANRFQINHYPGQWNRKLVLCEFTGVTTQGRQWDNDVQVARRMRIIRVVNRSPAAIKRMKGEYFNG